MSTIKRYTKWGVGAVLALLLLWFGRGLLSRGTAASPTSYTQVVTAQRGNLVASISPTGQVVAYDYANLTFDVNKLELLELAVTAGQQVAVGDFIARIDATSLQRALDQAEADLLTAEETLTESQSPYSALDLKKAELDVAQAMVALQTAREASPEQPILDAQENLEQATAKLAAVEGDSATQENLERLQWLANKAEVEHGGHLESGSTSEEALDRRLLAYNRMMDAKDNLASAQARAQLDLLTAQQAVDKAERTLAALRSPATSAALIKAHNQIAQAEYNLAKAQDALQTIQAGPDPQTVALAQARHDAALVTRDKAQAALDAATMVAPFAGTILRVNASVGDLVSPGTAIATLADLSRLYVQASVDETEVNQVKVGQDATITFDALTGQTFTGKVLEVPLEGTLSNSIVTYDVVLSLEAKDTSQLRSGMTANVKIITARRQNALLVPILAIMQGDSGNVVLLQENGSQVEAPVQIGLNDGTNVEILRGLNDGDQVVITYQASTSEQGIFPGMGQRIEILRSFEGGAVAPGGAFPPNMP